MLRTATEAHLYTRELKVIVLYQSFQTRTIPCFAPHSWLPCQRELDCDKAISYYKLQHSAISSTLIFAQPYLSQDRGIAHQPLHPHNILKSTSIASPRTTLLPFNERSVGFASALSPLSSPTLPKPHYPTKIATTLASPRKRGGGTADIIFWLAV